MDEKSNNAFRDENLLGFLMQDNMQREKEYLSKKRGKWELKSIIFKETYL